MKIDFENYSPRRPEQKRLREGNTAILSHIYTYYMCEYIKKKCLRPDSLYIHINICIYVHMKTTERFKQAAVHIYCAQDKKEWD